MYKSIGLPVIALNKAKAFHSIEELDRATRLFSRELALGSTIIPTKAASVLGWSSRRPISHGQGFTLDLQVGSGHFAAAVDQCKFEGLSFRSEEHTSELQSLMRISYAVFCLKKK